MKLNSKDCDLLKCTQEKYGSAYQNHLLSQYELYVKSVESISNRRMHANSHFITINVAIISFSGILLQVKWLRVALGIACLGIAICSIFLLLLCSYRQLNKAKFDIIQKMEEKLPAQVYGYEWKLLIGQKFYFPLSYIETAIPAVFFVTYLIFIFCL